jgi:hypothetical protein
MCIITASLHLPFRHLDGNTPAPSVTTAAPRPNPLAATIPPRASPSIYRRGEYFSPEHYEEKDYQDALAASLLDSEPAARQRNPYVLSCHYLQLQHLAHFDMP